MSIRRCNIWVARRRLRERLHPAAAAVTSYWLLGPTAPVNEPILIDSGVAMSYLTHSDNMTPAAEYLTNYALEPKVSAGQSELPVTRSPFQGLGSSLVHDPSHPSPSCGGTNPVDLG